MSTAVGILITLKLVSKFLAVLILITLSTVVLSSDIFIPQSRYIALLIVASLSGATAVVILIRLSGAAAAPIHITLSRGTVVPIAAALSSATAVVILITPTRATALIS